MPEPGRPTPGAPVEILGAGPAGLSAALTAAHAGREVSIFERRAECGSRFHGDLQGLENWTTPEDVLDELASMGIAPTFDHVAIRDGVFFGPDGRERRLRSDRPAFYLVRRGVGAGRNGAARQQCEGNENRRQKGLPVHAGIIATCKTKCPARFPHAAAE